MYCTKCGNPLGGEDKFCSKCGTKVLTRGETIESKQPNQTSSNLTDKNHDVKRPQFGHGSWTEVTGNEYVGEFKSGKYHGRGILRFPDGGKYDGEFSEGIVHGKGSYNEASGVKYEGEFKDAKRHGWGTEQLTNGDIYKGEWKYDKKHGQGTYSWANGDEYIGQWSDQKQHGQGTWTSQSGDRNVGEWKNGFQNGQGTRTFNNGDEYVGQFKQSEKHGLGIYTYSDGKIIDALWIDGKPKSKAVPSQDDDLTIGLMINYLSMGIQFNVKKGLFGKHKISKRQLIYIGALMSEAGQKYGANQISTGQRIQDQILQNVFGTEVWQDISRKSNQAWLNATSNLSIQKSMTPDLQLVFKAKEDFKKLDKEGDIPEFPAF